MSQPSSGAPGPVAPGRLSGSFQEPPSTTRSASAEVGGRFEIASLDDPFALFDLPVRFQIDRAALELAYRRVQLAVHPDRFALGDERERRLALQWATVANEAVRTLRDPLKRAAWLCESHGFAVAAETNTSMPSAFLNQQILWREALEDARESGDAIALESIRKGLQRTVDSLQEQLTRAIDGRADWPAAVLAVREWMFVERFSRDIEAAEEALY